MKASLVIGNPRKRVISKFNPSDAVKQRTAQVINDYRIGEEILHRPFTEFNNRSVIEEMNRNQRMFNAYVPPRSDDPDESWRAQTVRSIVRARLISIAAHVSASIIYPSFFAQNKSDEEDRASANVMRLISEWVINNSNYEMTFVNGVIQALTDPATVIQPKYLEVLRKIRDKDGNITGEVIDTVMSGFSYMIVSVRDLLITDVYEPNLQKQRAIIYRRKMDYQVAKSLYGHYENFEYVSPGVQVLLTEDNDTFYESVDESLDGNKVEVVCYYHRREDLELVFINGILVTSPDAPMLRQDKLYPFAKSGYEPLNNGNFFYYKSAANKLGPDEQLVNTLYNMIMDGTFLQLMPPLALYGGEEVGASVMVPGSITSFNDPNMKLESMAPRQDLRAGLMAIDMAEKSISESSQDPLRSGVSGGKEMTAREVVEIEQNAKIALGLFDKQIRFLVKDLGLLMVGDIKQYLTIPQVNDLLSPDQRLTYQKFLVPKNKGENQALTEEVRFTDEMFGKDEMSKEELRDKSFELYDKEGGPDSERKIYQVDPALFRNNEYKVVISPDALEMKNKALERALNLEAYDRAIQNPVANIEEVTREFLFETIRPGESGRFIRKPAEMQQPSSLPGGQKNVNQNLTGQLTKSNNLTSAMGGE